MTIIAPKYLKDDPWFGPPYFSDSQVEYKLAYDQAVAENLLLDDTHTEVKNIHEVMYTAATSHGKTTTQLNPLPIFGAGSEQVWISNAQFA
jgi:hypothetical protein